MTPAITIAIYEDGWEVSTHLQVGRRTFRCFTKLFSQFGSMVVFLNEWGDNWQDTAAHYFGYEGIEDLNETDHGPITPDLSSVMAALLPKTEPIKRRF